jgi:hypothetical protein
MYSLRLKGIRLTESQDWFLNEIEAAGEAGMHYFLSNGNKYQSIPSRTLNKLVQLDLVAVEPMPIDEDGNKWYFVKIK